jgi:hypothetical protein
VEACDVVSDGSEGELDGDFVEGAHAEAVELALFLEDSEDWFDEGFSSSIEVAAAFRSHLGPHGSNPAAPPPDEQKNKDGPNQEPRTPAKAQVPPDPDYKEDIET